MSPTTAQTASQTRNPDQAVPTRRISFEESLADLPKHFGQDGDLLLSHLSAVLSSLFPDGEDFFVRSVRHFRDQITDPALKRQVSGFIGQESVHGREHRVFNERLAQLGYATKFGERITKYGLATRERLASPKANLAATAALEHFTATMAETLLSDESARASLGHHAVRELFVWHALEESEHKSVAFDVYRAVGGSERMRIWTMKFIRVGLTCELAIGMLISLLNDRATFRPGRLRKSWARFKEMPLLSPEMWRKLKEYDRVGFHPTDQDTTELEAHWRELLFGNDGELVSLLQTPNRAA